MTAKLKDAQLDQFTDSALKIIMESSPVGIIVFGRDARVISFKYLVKIQSHQCYC